MRIIDNPEALESVITRPIFLVELGFTTKLHFSTAGDIRWNDADWKAESVSVGQISLNSLGDASVSIRINNMDRTFGVLVLAEPVKDRSARVWIYYPDGPIEPMELVSGVMDGANIGEYVDINIISKTSSYGQTPRILCARPVFNHLPPSGTTLTWANTSIKLERR